jgi:DNA polymerase-3 subunit epsilon
LCRSLSIDLKNAHRAKADARATTHILDLLLEKSDGNLEPYMYRHQKKLNRSLIPDELVEKLPVKAGVLYFLDGEQNVVYLVKSKNIRKKAWSIISRMNNKRYADIAGVSEGIDYYVTGSPLLASIRENEEIVNFQPRYNRKYKVFETRYSIYERIDKNGYLTFEVGMYDKELKGIINFAGQSEAKSVLEQTFINFNLRTSKQLEADAGLLFSENPEVYNLRASEAVDHLLSLRKNFIITDTGPEPGQQSMVVIRNGLYSGYWHADISEPVHNADEVMERINPSDDNPVAYKSIINYVSRGNYRKIIHF